MIWITGIGAFVIGVLFGIGFSSARFAPVIAEYRKKWTGDFAEEVAGIVRAKDEEIAKLEQIIRDNV